MYYFYILQSQKDETYYYGTTDDLPSRLEEHNRGQSKYTRHKRPLKLLYSEGYRTLSEARKREYQVKSKKRKSYVRWLINNKGG